MRSAARPTLAPPLSSPSDPTLKSYSKSYPWDDASHPLIVVYCPQYNRAATGTAG